MHKNKAFFYFRCFGSITIFHYKRTRRSTIEDVRKLKLNGKRYRNLTRKALKPNREVAWVASEGSCCWKIFSEIYFDGHRQIITTGFRGRPNFNIKSVKRCECF